MRLKFRQLCVLLTCVGCQQVPRGSDHETSPVVTPAAQTRIGLERGPCYGTCPSYRVTITASGRAYFVSTTAPERTDTLRVEPAAVARLEQAFLDAGFFSLDSAYVPGHPLCRLVATDHPSAVLTLEHAGQTKRIRHYHGCAGDRTIPSDSSSDRLRNPAGVLGLLKHLAVRVDSVAGTEAWLRSRAPAPVPTPAEITPAIPAAAAEIVGVDTSSLPTQLELAELGIVLDVPVQGVLRTRLRDTFSEPRGGRIHEALDILAPRGTPVVSATDGRLLKLFNSKAGGLMVYATDASERFILLYGHLDSYAQGLSDGMPLVRGQVIGYVGTTGNAPVGTPHLHFGILRGQPKVSWSKGVAVNPYPLLVAVKPAR